MVDEAWEMGDSFGENVAMDVFVLGGEEVIMVAVVPGESISSTSDRGWGRGGVLITACCSSFRCCTDSLLRLVRAGVGKVEDCDVAWLTGGFDAVTIVLLLIAEGVSACLGDVVSWFWSSSKLPKQNLSVCFVNITHEGNFLVNLVFVVTKLPG